MGYRNVYHSNAELMEWNNFSHCKFTMECWVCNGISSFISEVGEKPHKFSTDDIPSKAVHVLSTEECLCWQQPASQSIFSETHYLVLLVKNTFSK